MTTLDKEKFIASFESIRNQLAQDPLFEPESIIELKNAFGKLHPTYEGFFNYLYSLPDYPELPGDLYGSPHILYAILCITQKAITASAEQKEIIGSLEIEQEEEDEKVYFHHGDLIVSGDISVNEGALIVTGNLIVGGMVVDNDSQSLIIVGGDLQAQDVITDGTIFVKGNLIAQGLVLGVYNDYFLNVGGKIEAFALIEDDHPTLAVGGVHVQHHFDTDGLELRVEELQQLLVPDVLDEFEGLVAVDVGAVVSHLIEGVPIFRTQLPKINT